MSSAFTAPALSARLARPVSLATGWVVRLLIAGSALPVALLAATPPVADLAHFPTAPGMRATVPVHCVATGRVIHRFFDTSPISPSGRYLAVFRLPYEDRAPAAGDAGEVVLVDLATGRERVVATSRGWELQVGANVQWGATDAELYFNDVDPADWSAFAVRLDPATGGRRRLGGTVFMVSPDGRTLASFDLVSARFAQPGYGVVVPDDRVRRLRGLAEHEGIWFTDTKTGAARLLVSIAELYRRATPALRIADPAAHEIYCFQVKWNPQGTRLLTTLQWTPTSGGSRRRAVLTLRPDGTEVRVAIRPEQWARGGHHVNWAPDGEHLTMNLEADGQPGLELVQVRADGSDLRILFPVGSGHPSLHPRAPVVISDAYPYEPVAAGDGTSPLRFIDLRTGRESHLALPYVSMTRGELRVDPHPVWDRTGDRVVFNGLVEGTRSVFVARVGSLPALAAAAAPAGPAPAPTR